MRKLILVLLAMPFAANADAILYDWSPGTVAQIEAFERIGQSFVAEDELVEAGLFITPINPGFDDSDGILYELFAGLGTGGALVANFLFNLSEPFSDFFLVDFSSTPLTIGSTYSLVASIDGTSPLWGVGGTGEAPAGTGVCFDLGGCTSGVLEHALFVNPISVPEPSTLALLGIGLFGMGLARRNKEELS